ncbi:hypothetical protein EW026_g2345 [Hermanssonia centrifuga]|uniref:DUF6533 domain-containing protein n=1 Tax=Hermanssonia centrifuga TaxID=98765 RepID=A0A4S4KNN5_9APHY|nr:hypothetical protein EW026_g2345 [Hermanssonia centrifuga]
MPFDPTLDGHEIVQALQDANATRYLGAVGLVILFYDHLLTLPDEVKLVWGAPASFAKYAFLLNRYLVLASLITVAHAMAGFVPNAYSDAG